LKDDEAAAQNISEHDVLTMEDMLAEAYPKFLPRFGLRKFKASEASDALGRRILIKFLRKLCRTGYLVEISREFSGLLILLCL